VRQYLRCAKGVMMDGSVYDKTDKGREEIATRKYQLPARLRTLLVLVDGRRPRQALLADVAGLGLDGQHLDVLLAQQLIRLVPVMVAAVAATPVAATVDGADAAAQFSQVYGFYNRSIKAALGLRGVMLQLKVEKAVDVAQLRELRTPFLQAVRKARDAGAALALREELDALLGGAPADDPLAIGAASESGRGALDFFNLSNGAVDY
jgi:hypothetical protein